MEQESTGSRYKKGLPRELNINPYPPFLYGIVSAVVAALAAMIALVLVSAIAKIVTYNNVTNPYSRSTTAYWLVPGSIVSLIILRKVYKVVRDRLHKVVEDKAKTAASELLSNAPKSRCDLNESAAQQLFSCAMSAVCFYYDDSELFNKKNDWDKCRQIGTLFGLFAAIARFALKYGRETVEKYVLDARAVIEEKCGEEGARLFTLLCTDLYNGYAADAAIAEAGVPVDALMAIAKRFETDPIIHDTDGSYQLIAVFLDKLAKCKITVVPLVPKKPDSKQDLKTENEDKSADAPKAPEIVPSPEQPVSTPAASESETEKPSAVKNVRYVMPDGTVKEKSLTPEMISMLEQLPETTDHTGDD